jgi:hypothetical protein
MIGTFTELRRIASAHVVDHSNLNEKELRESLIKVKPQYLHYDTVEKSLNEVCNLLEKVTPRVLSKIFISDILLNQDDYILSCKENDEKIMSLEQEIINISNETEIKDLAASKTNPQRLRDFELYYFVLKVAWEDQSSKTPEEANLLRKLRTKLMINEWDHRVMEAKLGKFPKQNNELHTRGEIDQVRRQLQSMGLLFSIRDDKNSAYDVIPEELANVMRKIYGIEIKKPNYYLLLKHKLVRKKSYLQKCLEDYGIGWSNNDNLEDLVYKIVHYIQPSTLIGGVRGKDRLSNEELSKWCAELGLPVSGAKSDLIDRIILHYDSIRQTDETAVPEEEIYYKWFKELAFRDSKFLRSNFIISKDIEIESKFEEGTAYLFQHKLNHTPLKQLGTNHPDGLLSFRDMYIMWDNKSKETPGFVNLKDHIKQFHDYMEKSEKQVPIFLVIGPDFAEDSEVEALKYTSNHFGRNIVLIKAEELKDLAEEWNNESNKRREEPFPLGLLAKTGRFNRKLLGNL